MTDELFERFVRETGDQAVRFAHGYLGDWEEARDAAQEAFVKAHRRLASLKDEDALKGWFFSILANHLRDCLRRRKLKNLLSGFFGGGEEEMPHPGRGPYAGALDAERRASIVKAVEALPGRQREVFRMKSLAGLTFAEIASALAISDGAAKTHHARAVAALKAALAHWREED